MIELAPKRPDWLKVRAPGGKNYNELQMLMRDLALHTVCEEARCPNIGECWGHRTATFMILGDTCTRACGFCAVKTGRPGALDWGEPERVARAVQTMGLKHVVVTSVNRDDQPDGGSLIFAATIRKIRAYVPGLCTKSGIMVGLGEMRAEITQTMQDLRACDVDILTIGQYLRPTPQHLDIVRYYHPDEFAELKAEGLALGFKHVESGPLVRSSYHAHEHAAIAGGR